MDQTEYVTIVDQDGTRGLVKVDELAEGSRVRVQFGDDEQALVPVSMLTEQEDGVYHLPLSLSNLEEHRYAREVEAGDNVVIPVIEEELHVGKRPVETGRVRVTKTVHEEDEIIDIPLLQERFEVKRVPVNRALDGPVSVRYQGNTVIVPLVEEVIVVQKKLVLKEEIHLTKIQEEVREPKRVTLRSEEAQVERVEPEEADSS